MKTTLLNLAFLIVIILIIGILTVKVAIPRELHRQAVACQTMQNNGYDVVCE